MENNFNILLADDHRLFTEGLVMILKKHFPDATITIAESGDVAWQIIESKPDFDLLITDISMPGLNGVELTSRVKKVYPNIRVLVLTMHNEREIVSSILHAEAEGYVLKNSTAREINMAITNIMNNSTHYGKEIVSIMMQKIQIEKRREDFRKMLSDRELEVLQLIIEEHSSDEIAQKLSIGKRTVDSHRANILEKTGCKNIIALIKYALRNGYLAI
ncbi:MAG TPA: response regulator transcription factor [Chryseosolibacter sp.]|nr:response regulator transcription factor [Chryseosolibacter sp.]